MASLKVGELRSILSSFATALEANKADTTVVGGLRSLCAMLSRSEGKTVAAFLKAIESISQSDTASDGPLIASVVPTLSSFQVLVSGFAKKDLNTGLDSLLDALRRHADVPLSMLVAKTLPPPKSKGKGKKDAAPVDARLVDDYVQRLEAALGEDDKFNPLLEELKADKRVAQVDAICNRVAVLWADPEEYIAPEGPRTHPRTPRQTNELQGTALDFGAFRCLKLR